MRRTASGGWITARIKWWSSTACAKHRPRPADRRKTRGDGINALFDLLPSDTIMNLTVVVYPQDKLEQHISHLSGNGRLATTSIRNTPAATAARCAATLKDDSSTAARWRFTCMRPTPIPCSASSASYTACCSTPGWFRCRSDTKSHHSATGCGGCRCASISARSARVVYPAQLRPAYRRTVTGVRTGNRHRASGNLLLQPRRRAAVLRS